MKIEKTEKCIKIKLDEDEKINDFVNDFVYSDDLSFNDLNFHFSSLDGFAYIIDTNQNKVYEVDGHFYSIDDFIKGLNDNEEMCLDCIDDEEFNKDIFKEFYGDNEDE